MAIQICKDSKIVDVIVAQAQGKSVDSAIAEQAGNLIKDQASDPTPHNRYQIAQLVGFAVNEINKPKANWLENVGDVKRVGYGEKAQFKVKQEGIRAFIQAKGSTTARSKVANKTMSLDTVSVSARPVINLVELRTGQAQMSDLIVDAAYQMELAQYGYIQKVLNDAAKNWSTPYYGSGSGIVKATLDPMIRHWMRMSGGAAPIILGDINMVSKLADVTGFTASTSAKQFADDIMLEQNNAGFIGVYNGCKVVNLVNPLIDGTDNPVFDTNKLFLLPGNVDASMRPLKVVFEGDVQSQEETNIDDKTFEVRLDQDFGAAVVYGDRPYVSVYEDTSI